MSIELADSTGAIGQASTNTGFEDAMAIVEESNLKELKKLFVNGVTKNPKQASKDALELAHKVKDNQIRATLVNVSNLLSTAKEFAVVQTA
jgi:hypothetical protein